jgi:TRAP-type mannitol/chloroaromatic compound transport system substrate-binding protein
VATARYDHVNPGAMRKLIAGGTQLRVFSRDVMDACHKAAMDQYAEWSDKHPEFKKLYASYSKYLQEELDWFRVAEGTFDNYMVGRSNRKK